jgi:hypothetical protein
VDTRTFVFQESIMARKHPPFTPEFRRQMIELGSGPINFLAEKAKG